MFLKDLILSFIGGLILIIFILIGVAFLTLLERKILGYIQIRKGPNKIRFAGIIQPFSDAIKLFSKEQIYPNLSNYLIYYIFPIFSLFLSIFLWMRVPYIFKIFSFNYGLLFFLCCLSIRVYGVLGSGWSSNSNYALLGGLRAVAQTISYEVSLSLILITFILLILSFNIMIFSLFQNYVWFLFICFPLRLCWFASSLAEANRTPFDFAEGESELVSGFNVEYGRGGFSLIFLAEYAMILFLSIMFSLIFLGGNLFSLIFYLKLRLVAFLFIWVRGAFPRFRYDKLIYLAWKRFLPISLNYLFFFLGLEFFFFLFCYKYLSL